MIDNEFKRLEKEVEWPEDLQCTVEETEYIKGRRMSMATLWNHLFEEPMGNQHRAKDDVVSLIAIYKKLVEQGIVNVL